MRPVFWFGPWLIVLAASTEVRAQANDRTRVETEAAGQAAEADRLFKRGEWEPALAIYEAERTSRAALGDVRYEAYALRAIGICRAELGDDESAIESWNQARVLDLKRDDKGYAGYDDFLIAQAHLRLGRIDDGLKSLNQALPLLSQAVDRDHEADARLVLTRTLIGLGQAEAARPHVDRAIALAEELDDPVRLADAWASSGQLEGALGNLSLAFERFSDARERFEQQGRAAEAAWMETATGSTLILMGRPELALARFEEAARLHDHLEDGGSMAEDLTAIAGLHLEARRVDQALTTARQAVEKAREADDREREVEARVRLAQVEATRGDWPAAAATMNEAVGLIRTVARDNPAEQVRILILAADADRLGGQIPRARQRIETASKLVKESNLTPIRQAVEEAQARLEASEAPPAPPKP